MQKANLIFLIKNLISFFFLKMRKNSKLLREKLYVKVLRKIKRIENFDVG